MPVITVWGIPVPVGPPDQPTKAVKQNIRKSEGTVNQNNPFRLTNIPITERNISYLSCLIALVELITAPIKLDLLPLSPLAPEEDVTGSCPEE